MFDKKLVGVPVPIQRLAVIACFFVGHRFGWLIEPLVAL
jgi:hypothetical protein